MKNTFAVVLMVIVALGMFLGGGQHALAARHAAVASATDTPSPTPPPTGPVQPADPTDPDGYPPPPCNTTCGDSGADLGTVT